MAKVDVSRVTAPSIALIHLPIEKAFEILAGIGFKKVDLLEKMPHFSLFDDECDVNEIKKAAIRYGLQISFLNTYVGGGAHARESAWRHHPGFQFPNRDRYTSTGFASDDPDELNMEYKHVCHAIDLAVFLGARGIRFVPGDDDPGKIDKMVPWLKKCAAYAEKRGICMATENHDTGIMGTPEILVDLINKIGSPNVGVIYEPLNLLEQASYDYRKAFEVMREHILHVHFKDGKLFPDVRNYRPVMMGEGELDFRWILNRLEDIGYQHEIALEYEVAEVPPEEGLRQYFDNFFRFVVDNQTD